MPSRVNTAISDWIVGLSMRDFAQRRLTSEPIDASVVKLSVDALRSAIGDTAVFSGIYRSEPIFAALEAMLHDEEKYAEHASSHGPIPQ